MRFFSIGFIALFIAIVANGCAHQPKPFSSRSINWQGDGKLLGGEVSSRSVSLTEDACLDLEQTQRCVLRPEMLVTPAIASSDDANLWSGALYASHSTTPTSVFEIQAFFLYNDDVKYRIAGPETLLTLAKYAPEGIGKRRLLAWGSLIFAALGTVPVNYDLRLPYIQRQPDGAIVLGLVNINSTDDLDPELYSILLVERPVISVTKEK